MKKIKCIIAFVLAVTIIASCIGGCASNGEQEAPQKSGDDNQATEAPQKEMEEQKQEAEKAKFNVISLKGPTGMGMAPLMDKGGKGETDNDYTFSFAEAPDEVGAKLINGEVDIAAIPINLAATLYNKTEGKLHIIALNTLGVLYIMENGNSITSFGDLAGKDLYATGQGATPEFILNYLLGKNDIIDKVNISYMNDHAELGTRLAAGDVSIAMLPEPQVTAAALKNQDLRIALSLTEEWDKVSNGAKLVQGCIVVRSEVLQNNKEGVKLFLDEYAKSVEFANQNIDETAKLIVEYGIMGAEPAAKKALPNANIVCITGQEMKTDAHAMLNVLFEAEAKSIGGSMPDDNIYWVF